MYHSPPFAFTGGISQISESLLSKSPMTSGTLNLSLLTITGCAVFMFVCIDLLRALYCIFCFDKEFLTNDVLDTHLLVHVSLPMCTAVRRVLYALKFSRD